MRRTLFSLALVAITTALAGCVTQRAGTAVIDRGDIGSVAFEGLLSPDPANTVRHIFITHGMGPTDDNFGDIVIDRLAAADFKVEQQWSNGGDWIPIQLPSAVRLKGEALHCSDSSSAPPCVYRTFGGMKVDKLVRHNEVTYVYRYFWDRDLRLIQEPFVKNDEQVHRSSFIGELKHSLINYGFTDAAAYLGPLGDVLRSSAEGAICSMMKQAAGTEPSPVSLAPCRFANLDPTALPASARFYFISHSLGSRLVFDTLTPAYNRSGACLGRETDVKTSLLGRTDTFFMLANQLPLLALGQVSVRPASPPSALSAPCPTSITSMLAASRSPAATAANKAWLHWPTLPPLQIVSFQDPEDLLGFRFSDDLASNATGRLRVVQVSHRNTPVYGPFGRPLASNPKKAHATELYNDSSATLIFCGASIAAGRKLVPVTTCLDRGRKR